MSLRSLADYGFDEGHILVAGIDQLPDSSMPAKEARQRITTARRLIQSKYDAGIPFFTKNTFQDVVRQFESNGNPGHHVSVTGLDGGIVYFPLETGKEYRRHPYGADLVCVKTKPQLRYNPIDSLVANPDVRYPIPISHLYLPVEVVYSTEIRDARTHELVTPYPTSDYATVKQRFEQARQSLQAGELFAQLKSTLASAAVPPGIDKIVALACSTMSWADDSPRSIAQHILALSVRDFLASRGGAREIKCYTQEPMYMPADEQVLSEAGFTVVDDPSAFLEVDEASVVISVYPDIPVRQIVADIARPAMMIWNKVVVRDQGKLWTDQVTPRVEKMMEEYTELPFPEDEELFGDLAIYVRNGASAANEE